MLTVDFVERFKRGVVGEGYDVRVGEGDDDNDVIGGDRGGLGGDRDKGWK